MEPDQHLQLPPAGGGRDAGPGDRLRDVQRDRGARRGARARRRGRRWARSSAGSRSSSTPACASSRSTPSCARCRVLWEELGRERYGVEDAKHLRFRYGVQVNSLGLTESQPENNVQRIVLEALAVTMGRNARARAIQLPAWNEALGLPRPWDQQWSLRIQQVLAYETDLLEYPDIFEGSKVMEGLVAELLEGARAEMAVVAEHGGAVKAVDYMKAALVDSHRERLRRIEAGEQIVVGLNKYADSEPSPLLQGADGGILTVDPEVEAQQRDAVEQWRAARDQGRGRRGARRARARRRRATRTSCRRRSRPRRRAPRPASGRRRCATRSASSAPRPASARPLRRRPPTTSSPPCARRSSGCPRASGARSRSSSASPASTATPTAPSRSRSARATPAWTSSTTASASRRRRSRRARSSRRASTSSACRSSSGSHRELIPSVVEALKERGVDVPVVVGGIIPEADVEPLKAAASPPSTPPRTSTSRRSCATSSRWSRSATGWPRAA